MISGNQHLADETNREVRQARITGDQHPADEVDQARTPARRPATVNSPGDVITHQPIRRSQPTAVESMATGAQHHAAYADEANQVVRQSTSAGNQHIADEIDPVVSQVTNPGDQHLAVKADQGPILQRWGRPHFWSGDVRRPLFSGPMGTEAGGACLQVAPPAGGLQQHQREWDRVVTKAPWRCES